MGFLIVQIPIACCVAVPAVIAVAAFVGSRKRDRVQNSLGAREGARQSLAGEEGRK